MDQTSKEGIHCLHSESCCSKEEPLPSLLQRTFMNHHILGQLLPHMEDPKKMLVITTFYT